ncbi:MAG: calcium/sodium antiporter [candidate division KSB1 bacterium]|nr:calcium/sodium antiporter [candidate division KSB1 bacterium]
MLLASLKFLLGVGALFLGAEALVRGASGLARRLRVHPLIVGLTVVAFGTSAPELVVSLAAALRGKPDLSLGNVVGSNIANVGLVLGLAAVVHPLRVGAKTLFQEGPIMIATQLIVLAMALRDARIGRFDGFLLLASMLAFTWLMVHRTVADRPESAWPGRSPANGRSAFLLGHAGMVVAGISALTLGADFVIDSASLIAFALGVSPWVIGNTLIAVGTSLPELATSVVASYRREDDISVGNVVGSNIFNVLLILGAVSVVSPLPIPSGTTHFELPAMVLFSILAVGLMFTGRRLTRTEGLLLVVLYSLFVKRLV